MNKLCRSIFPSLLFVALVLFTACSTTRPTPPPTAVPTVATPSLVPASTPANSPASPATLTPTITATPTIPVSFDGRWDGGTEANSLLSGEILFQVENNRVTEIAFNYTLQNSGCTLVSGYHGTADRATTEGNQFTAEMEGDGKVLTLAGTFTGPKEANGTLEFRGQMEDCPDFDRTVKWTAQNVPVPPTATPTETPLPKSVEVTRRDGDLTILPNGDVMFIETWEVHFIGGPFSSAYRSWLFGGYDSIDDWGVTESGKEYSQSGSHEPYTFEVTQANAQNTLTWYFPPTMDETRTFTVQYTVHGAVRNNGEGNAFTWKFIEGDRAYPIDSTHVIVHLPEEVATAQIAGTYSQNGEPSKDGTVLDGQTIQFEDGPIPPGADLELNIYFPTASGLATPTRDVTHYDGEWRGSNSESNPIFILVSKNEIGYALVSFSYTAGGCSGSDAQGGIVTNAAIKDDRFAATFTDATGRVFRLVGRFTSPTQALGTVEVKGKVSCGDEELDAIDTWSAEKTEVVETPTPAATSSTPLLGREFSLRLGQTVTLDDGLKVTFEGVPADGRCSSCTASFPAEIDLTLAASGNPSVHLGLQTPPLPGTTATLAPYSIKFVRLEPQRVYPNDSLNPADYMLTLLITKTQ